MTSQKSFHGYSISFEMIGGMGYFQGIVTDIDEKTQQIKLSNVIHDGRPANVKQMTFSAHDIKGLEVLSTPSEINVRSHGQGSEQNADEKTSNIYQRSSVKSAAKHLEQKPNSFGREQSDLIKDFSTNFHISHRNISKNHRSNEIFNENSRILRGTGEFIGGEPVSETQLDKNAAEPFSVGGRRKAFLQFMQCNQRDQNQAAASSKSASKSSNGAGRTDSPYHTRYSDSTNNRKRYEQHQKNQNTFGRHCNISDINEEFDFEGNNKLFDKEAVAKELDQMRQEQQLQALQQPDVVSQTDRRFCLSTTQASREAESLGSEKCTKTEPKYRCDQNVIQNTERFQQHISLPPEEIAQITYSTDNGCLVPGLSTRLKTRLLSSAMQLGFSISRQHEMTARAAAELSIQLLGGEHRFNLKNQHQLPNIVVLCGAHHQGCLGLNTARQLVTHDLPTVVLTPSVVPSLLPYTHELNLLTLAGGKLLHSVADLPSHTTFDLILDARFDLNGCAGTEASPCTEWVTEMTAWARRQRCPVLALDPPGYEHSNPSLSLPSRALVVPALPLVYGDQQGIVHLVKLPLPHKLFQDHGIAYSSPFQAKFMVTLHPCE